MTLPNACRIIEVLEADERVLIAWLTGSIGRGTEDDWSDLHLYTAVGDEAYKQVELLHAALEEQGVPVPREMPSEAAHLARLAQDAIDSRG